ncbi:hypothetical protein [Burkholderia cenocepacia]|nr:hypothetical protein [Burkholderia cenocepacia]
MELFDTNLDAVRKTFASTLPTLQSMSVPSDPDVMRTGHIGIYAFSTTS